MWSSISRTCGSICCAAAPGALAAGADGAPGPGAAAATANGRTWRSTTRGNDARSVQLSRPGRRRNRRLTAVRFRLQGGVLRRLLDMLLLHRSWRNVPLARSGALRGSWSCSRSARAVVADFADVRRLVDDGLVVGVVHHCHIDVSDGRVVGKGTADPACTDKTDANITKPVIDATVEADVRSPVADVEHVPAADEAPVAGRPQQPHRRGGDPRSRHPEITGRRKGPIARRPQEAYCRARWLLVIRQRRRRFGRLDLHVNSRRRRRRCCIDDCRRWRWRRRGRRSGNANLRHAAEENCREGAERQPSYRYTQITQ